jgi:hypothetical protein
MNITIHFEHLKFLLLPILYIVPHDVHVLEVYASDHNQTFEPIIFAFRIINSLNCPCDNPNIFLTVLHDILRCCSGNILTIFLYQKVVRIYF